MADSRLESMGLAYYFGDAAALTSEAMAFICTVVQTRNLHLLSRTFYGRNLPPQVTGLQQPLDLGALNAVPVTHSLEP